MIAFVTLLLGLISGVYPIEVSVSGSVSVVEFTLDGGGIKSLTPQLISPRGVREGFIEASHPIQQTCSGKMQARLPTRAVLALQA